jgi:hypothetical protein
VAERHEAEATLRRRRPVIQEVTEVEPPAARARRLFVAYPYEIPKADYRRPFTELAKAFDVEFQFADEKITNQHILDKITEMIVGARFSLFDVTRWNANVALELGIAIGGRRPYYLLFNPDDPKNPKGDVPADLGGLDRIQYRSYAELEEGLTKLLAQEFGVRRRETADPVATFRGQVPKLVRETAGLRIGEIAEHLGIPIGVAQVVVRPLVASGELETTGTRRATRYYVKGASPRRAAKSSAR